MHVSNCKDDDGRLLTILLAAFIAAVWFAGPHLRTLTEPDEGRYAEIPREMLATGDWITPHLDGIPYLEKPPLQYWATAVAYRVLGESAWVSRLWTAGLGFLGLGTVYFLAKRLFGVLAARFASLILASCPLYVVLGQISVLDMGLAFFLTCALG